MVKRETLLALNYYKKAIFTGGTFRMRYRIEKCEEGLRATVWRGPLGYDAVPEEEKTVKMFVYAEEGLEEAADWISKEEKEREEYWAAAPSLFELSKRT